MSDTMKAADGTPISERIRSAALAKIQLVTGWYESNTQGIIEEACTQWAMAEERERGLIAEVKKANLWLAHRQQVIDNFFAALATPAPEPSEQKAGSK